MATPAPLRIGIGQLWQETNTFNPRSTTRREFENFGVLRGTELIERLAETNEPGGFIQQLRRWPRPVEIVGLARLPAWPSGPATAETLAWIEREFIEAINRSGPLDGLLLALHGAMVAEGTPDVEGAILTAIRRRIGPTPPIVATLDLHANVTRAMVEQADALILYHTAPHVDVFETGERAARVLKQIVLEGVRPTMAWRKLPMVVPAERANTQDAASVSFALREHLEALERQPGILAAGLATVQPWLDIPDLGSAVVVVTRGDALAAQRTADEVAQQVWKRRNDYLPQLTDLEPAVRAAHDTPGLVVLSDSADATTSGAPGESTFLLHELLRYDWTGPVLVPFVSANLVMQAEAAGMGQSILAHLEGHPSSSFAQSLTHPFQIERLFDARFVMSGHLAKNLSIDMGRSVVLRTGEIRLIVTSRSGPHFAPELLHTAGLNPFQAKCLIAKSPCGFRAAYEPHATAIHVVRAPGCAASDFWNLPYRAIPRPLWPWDPVEI